MSKQSLIRTLEETIMCSQVSRKRDGTKHILFRKGYFYTNGQSTEDFVNSISRQLTQEGYDFTVKDSGNHWAAFSGGKPVAKQSHFWVEVKIEEA